MGWSFWDQVTKWLGSPYCLPSPAPCLLLALREARLHVMNCLMESPTWQGTKGSFQKTPTEELRPLDLQPMRNQILPTATFKCEREFSPRLNLQMRVKLPFTPWLQPHERDLDTEDPNELHHDSCPTETVRSWVLFTAAKFEWFVMQ